MRDVCIRLALILIGVRILYGSEQRIEHYIEDKRTTIEIISDVGVKYPRVVLAQGILETGWFDQNNPIFSENNNWLGLKCATYRKTYCIGTSHGHAVFRSKEECLLDYLEWQSKYLPRYEEKHGKIQSEDDYLDFLLKWKYAEDQKYITKLKRILNTIKTESWNQPL